MWLDRFLECSQCHLQWLKSMTTEHNSTISFAGVCIRWTGLLDKWAGLLYCHEGKKSNYDIIIDSPPSYFMKSAVHMIVAISVQIGNLSD